MALTTGLKGITLINCGRQAKIAPHVCSPLKFRPGYFIPSANAMFGPNTRDPNYKRPPPFPYKTTKYSLFHRIFDRTTYRFDDNTKLIIVEGLPAVGKTALAKQLAEDFDMLHLPDVTMDSYYINPYGRDLRDYNDRLSPNAQTYDEKDFCTNPTGRNAAIFQVLKYKLRFAQHIDALAHILSTGQGVVMERSPHTDIAFAEAMYKNGFMSRKAWKVYQEIIRHTLFVLMKPHVFIFLDVPVPTALQKIKERDLPHERNSPALTEQFLTDLDNSFKERLTQMGEQCEILVYDWTEGGEPDIVVEDLEKIDFDCHTHSSEPKFSDWRKPKEVDYCDHRQVFADLKSKLMTRFNIQNFEANELYYSGNEVEELFTIIEDRQTGGYFREGYNEHLGDKSVWWRHFMPYFQKEKWDPLA